MKEPVTDVETNRIDVKSLIAVSIPWLIVCGFGELSVYYMQFDLNLLSYFNISDVFPSILPELVTLTLVVLIIIIVVFFMTHFMKVKDNDIKDDELTEVEELVEDVEKPNSVSTREPPWYIDLFMNHLPYGLGSGLTLLLYITFLKYHDSGNLAFILGMAVVVVVSLTYIYRITGQKIKSLVLSKELNFINNCFIALFITSCFIGYIRADLTKFNYYKGTSILINGKIKNRDTTYYIVSDTNRYYIGKTSSYIIFYNSIKEAATLYPISEVKEVNLQLKKPPAGPPGGANPPDPIPGDPLPLDPTHPRRSVRPNK